MAEHIKRQINNLKKVQANNQDTYIMTIENIQRNCVNMKHNLYNNRCYQCDKDLNIINENYGCACWAFSTKIYELQYMLSYMSRNKLR